MGINAAAPSTPQSDEGRAVRLLELVDVESAGRTPPDLGQRGNLQQSRGDSTEILYRTPDNRMVATEITTAGGRVEVGRSQTLFDMGNVRRGGMSWDVAPNGQRFLVVMPTDSRSQTSIGFLQNWPALLGKQ